jgi:tetratricopeptide (TPR) repeat protein
VHLARLGLVLVGLALCSPAMGDASKDATRLLARGKALFADGDFRRSREALLRAAERANEPELLGQIYLHLGLGHAAENQTDDARKAFRTALTHDPKLHVDPRRHKKAFVELFEEVRRATVGELVVALDPPGDSEVVVDGKTVGRAPFQTRLLAGLHQVEIRSSDGRRLRTRTVQVNPGQSARLVFLGMQPDRRGAASRPAPPPKPLPLPPAPRRDRPPRRIWTWVAAGGAVASAAIAIGVGVSASQDHDAGCELLADPSLPCEERDRLLRPEDRSRYLELQDSLETKNLVANIAWGIAAACAVAAPLLYWLEGRAAGRQARTARVRPAPGARGLSFELSF